MVLLALSIGALALAVDVPAGPLAAAGGIGAVLASSLLGLTLLVAVWQRGVSGAVASARSGATDVADDDALAAAFDDPADADDFAGSDVAAM